MSTFSDIIDNRALNLKDEILSKLDGSEKVKFAVIKRQLTDQVKNQNQKYQRSLIQFQKRVDRYKAKPNRE